MRMALRSRESLRNEYLLIHLTQVSCDWSGYFRASQVSERLLPSVGAHVPGEIALLTAPVGADGEKERHLPIETDYEQGEILDFPQIWYSSVAEVGD